ncbi:MAG: YmdB family metallophosphoesterase [Cyanobacteria bacterium SIG31]|nr:YmdB family metallophosphoesterase [Cyanobacteria bacterium SIG31]
MEQTYKILFFGDITGRQGRNALKSFLSSNKDENTFVIANIENASHGFGLTKKNYLDLAESGVDCFTSGNHIWDKKDVYEYIKDSTNLVRPINYPTGTPGKGSQIFNFNGIKIAVINVLGRVFMPPMDSPWQIVVEEINNLKSQNVDSIFIDFHAEATAEKICFSKFLAKEFNTDDFAIIKGFFGTHTHVQTADEQIINGMAYITDAGFCGSADGVIGMEYSTSLKRLSTSLPERYEIAENGLAQINGVEVLIDRTRATQIKRINILVDNIKNEKEADLDSGG